MSACVQRPDRSLARLRRANAAGWALLERITASGVLLDEAALRELAAWIRDEGLPAAAAFRLRFAATWRDGGR